MQGARQLVAREREEVGRLARVRTQATPRVERRSASATATTAGATPGVPRVTVRNDASKATGVMLEGATPGVPRVTVRNDASNATTAIRVSDGRMTIRARVLVLRALVVTSVRVPAPKLVTLDPLVPGGPRKNLVAARATRDPSATLDAYRVRRARALVADPHREIATNNAVRRERRVPTTSAQSAMAQSGERRATTRPRAIDVRSWRLEALVLRRAAAHAMHDLATKGPANGELVN